MIDLAAAVTGGYANLRRKPYFWCAVEPVSPLVQGNDAVEKTLLCAEYGIPNVGYSMLMGGASAPATFAGILSLANAETLTLLLISQLKKEGAPYVYGAIPNIMDMKTAVFTYGSPELSLLVGALTEVSHHYQLPMWGTAGCTDAKHVGLQTGLEVMQQCMLSSFTGADFIHDVGLIANGMQVSPELIVLVDEVIGMVDVTMRGIAVDEAAFALDLIEKVGPGGNFISEDHTFQHFRSFWQPSILDRTTGVRGSWDDKRMHSEALLKEKTINLMESHQPQRLPEELEREVRAAERSWFGRLGLDYEQLQLSRDLDY
jgi:trimethylamine--corrinoid protein Co-methyltransferase